MKAQPSAKASRPERGQALASQQASGVLEASSVAHGVLILSDRDRRVLAWLLSHVGPEQVAVAAASLAGARKPFVSNVAKALGLKPPADLAQAERGAAQARLAELRASLPGLWKGTR